VAVKYSHAPIVNAVEGERSVAESTADKRSDPTANWREVMALVALDKQ
jgi:hypothetical protein